MCYTRKRNERNEILRDKILPGKPDFEKPQFIVISKNFSLKKPSCHSFGSDIAPTENACCSPICIIKLKYLSCFLYLSEMITLLWVKRKIS